MTRFTIVTFNHTYFAVQDTTSFFSVQFSVDTQVQHSNVLVFDRVIVNYGDDYLESGGIYLYV